MKIIKYLLLSMMILTVAGSCNKSNDPIVDPDPILDITEKKLSFTNDVGEKNVTITVNEGNHYSVAWIGEKWGEYTVTPTGLKVIVQKHTGEAARTAKIEVMLAKGGLKETIDISQAGTASVLTVSEDNIHFQHLANKATVNVDNATENWTISVTGAGDWLTATADKNTHQVKIEAKAATTTVPRSAEITVTSEGQTAKINVKQEGTLYFFLPSLEFNNMTIVNLIEYEKSRGNVFFVPNSGNWRTNNMFNSDGPIFWRLVYYSTDLYHFNSAQMFLNDEATLDSPELHSFLEENGFKFQYEDTESDVPHKAYWNEEKQSVLSVNKEDFWADYGESHIWYFNSNERPEKPYHPTGTYTTFDNYPFIFSEFGKFGEDALAWEMANGGRFAIDVNTVFELRLYPQSGDCIVRSYLINPETGLTESVQIFKDWKKALYPSIYGDFPTNEFHAMMVKEGFVMTKYDIDNGPTYVHAEKGISLMIKRWFFRDIKGEWANRDVLAIWTTKYEPIQPTQKNVAPKAPKATQPSNVSRTPKSLSKVFEEKYLKN